MRTHIYNIILLFWLLVIALYATPKAYGAKTTYNFENVEYVTNYDGDTVTVNLRGNIHDLLSRYIRIRVRGIDTDELSGRHVKPDLRKAKRAKHFTERVLKMAKRIDLKNCTRGTFFRLVCDVFADRKSLASMLLQRNLAVPYKYRRK